MPRSLYRILIVCVIGCLLTLSATAQSDATEIPDDIALLIEQAVAQPEDFALGCMPLNNPGRTVAINASEPFPLASVSKLLIFIEFAQRVQSGLIPRNEQVGVAILESYTLPGTDRGAHDRFMRRYAPETVTIPIWDVAAEGMMQYSSNAASDFLLDRMAPIDWGRLYATLSINNTSMPHAMGVIPLLMNNHVDGMTSLESVPDLTLQQAQSYLRSYLFNAAWREREVSYRVPNLNNGRQGSSRNWPEWETQAAVLQQHTAVGTVRDFLAILNAVYSTSPIGLSAGVRATVREAMRWDENTWISDNYVEFGSKLGFYSGGVLTLVAYGQPINGEAVLSVIFLRNIPREVYYDLLREDEIGDLAHWMNFNACSGLSDLIN